MMADQRLLIMIIVGILTLLIGVDTNRTPRVTVTEGNSVRLECRTTVRSLVDWQKEFDSMAPGTYIVVATRLMPQYKTRFDFDNNTYSLTIHNATINDSGLYYCVEDKGAGQQHFVRLNVDVDNCVSPPCENNGICINEVNSFHCSCTDGFTGINCQIRIISTGASSNQTPTVTVTEGNIVRMECRTTVRSLVNWRKELDSEVPDTYIVVATRLIPQYKMRFEFDNNTYMLTIHNVTVSDSGLYYCVDDKGAGQQHFVRLNVDVDECASSPCENGGICIDKVNSYQCNCIYEFTGVSCQIRSPSTALSSGTIFGICVGVIVVIVIIIFATFHFFRAKFSRNKKGSDITLESQSLLPLQSNSDSSHNVEYVNSHILADSFDFISERESQVFDDGKRCKKDPSIYVTGMTICTRHWDGHIIVGGLKIQYSTKEVAQYGSQAKDGNTLHPFELEEDEKIVKVIVRSGWMIDSMTFYTNKDHLFGPYGGNGGYEHTLEYSHYKSYLAYIKGRIDIAEGEPALRGLELVWGYKCPELQDVYCPIPVKQLETQRNVLGMTQLDCRIFVLYRHLNAIDVFGLDYEKLKVIIVEGLAQPNGIAACIDTGSLYVADTSSAGCVWLVSKIDQVSKFLPKTEISCVPASISVTSSRLLVTTNDGRMLLLHGSDGVELKRLSFTDISIRHAVETSRGTFVLCCHEPQVVEVDANGQIMFCYHDEQYIKYPCHMSFDSDSGNLFIADYEKHHILLLTSELKFDRVLLDNEHNQLVKNPHRLHYVAQVRQLLVSNWSISTGISLVQVFSVS